MTFYDYNFFQYLEALARNLRAQPLNLGGIIASGGGGGGPPGGFIGMLPQTRVAYDLTEAEISGFVSPYPYDVSGVLISASLLDNLNHIRYRISVLEPGGEDAGVDIYNNDILVATGVTIIDFHGAVSVVDQGGGEVDVTISGIDYTHYYNDDLNSQIPTVSGGFYSTTNDFIVDTLRVYYNGLRQRPFYYTEAISGFTLDFATIGGDELLVDYEY